MNHKNFNKSYNNNQFFNNASDENAPAYCPSVTHSNLGNSKFTAL